MKFSHPSMPAHEEIVAHLQANPQLIPIQMRGNAEGLLDYWRQTEMPIAKRIDILHGQQVKFWATLEAAGFGGDTEPEPEPPKAV